MKTMNKVRKTSMKGKVLMVPSEDELVVYYKGNILIYNTKSEQVIKKITVPLCFFIRFLCKIRLIERVLHSEPRWMIKADDDEIFYSIKKGIYRIDDGSSSKKINIEIRGTSLQAARIEGVGGFSDQIVCGDYGQNTNRDSVSIYSYKDKTWERVFSFAPGTVKHIHGFFPDAYRGCVYVLTGDSDEESGIWIAQNDFKDVCPFLVGSQQYRACQMFIQRDHVYYMTDAPSESNYIYEIQNGMAVKLREIYGTCIYGTCFNNMGLYSTTVEPNVQSRSKIDRYFSSKPGSGIKGSKTKLFSINYDGTYNEIASFEHDGLPLRLFQYGTITFTNEYNGRVFFSPLCVNEYDRTVFEMENY